MASEDLQAPPPPPPPPQEVAQPQDDLSRGMQPLAPQPVQQQQAPVDSLTCQWVGCGERCTSPETLYVRDINIFYATRY